MDIDKDAAGWRDVERWCRELTDSCDELAVASVSAIRRQLPIYGAVHYDEHLAAVTGQQRDRLLALSQGRTMNPQDLQRCADLARRRASQGIPLAGLIGAFHIGDQELWRHLVRYAEADKTHVVSDVATLMMESLQDITTSLAAAHAEVVNARHSHRVTLGQRLIELIRQGEHTRETLLLAAELGIDEKSALYVTARFQNPSAEMPRLVGGGIVGNVDGFTVRLLSADRDPDIADLAQTGPIGMSRRHVGIQRATTALQEAVLALHAASRQFPVATIDTDWLVAAILSRRVELTEILAPAAAVAKDHPHLAQAVETFAAQGFSTARTASTLHLHANSVTYRLRRWSELTGHDPRSVEGAAASLAGIRLIQQQPAEA